jgi:hypothetical protein
MSVFTAYDLEVVDSVLLRPASAVISVREAFAGNARADSVVLRHDVDDNAGSMDCALRLAKWEAARGYRSTYYLLHTASYWGRPSFNADCRELASLGHEVGIHADAIGWCFEHGGDPHVILAAALRRLRDTGVAVTGVAAHGNALCRDGQRLVFVNDEIFEECPRPEAGPRPRAVGLTEIDPLPLSSYGLTHAAERLPHGWRLSDSGGVWSVHPQAWRAFSGQLHFLMHPDWWTQAL